MQINRLLLLTTLLATAALNGCGSSGDGGSGLLNLDNLNGTTTGSGATTGTLVLTCPNGVSPGSTVTGFQAALTASGGKPVSNVFVAINATNNAVVNAPPEQDATFGANTDAKGLVPFSLKVPSDAGVGSRITLTAKVSSGQFNTSATCAVPVRANNFVLVKPVDSTQTVGNANAKITDVNWTTASGTGVSGKVTLTATNNGTFTFNKSNAGDPTVTVNTDQTGQIPGPLYFICGKAAFAKITATAAQDASLTDSKTIQCLDYPAVGKLTSDQANVSIGATTNLPTFTYLVTDSQGNPLPKQSITFELTQNASSDDKLQPTTSVTNSSGKATTQYQPGQTGGTATVKACTVEGDINGQPVCDSRSINVQ